MDSSARIVCWFSCGAASAVATRFEIKEAIKKKLSVTIAYCDPGSEHPDNKRFMRECEVWFGQSVEVLRSDKYRDTWQVWKERKYLAGIDGAPCTVAMKVEPRLVFQYPTDIHVFGYTSDAPDAARATRLRHTYPELSIRTPLIDRGLNKAACLAIVEDAGIVLPTMYSLGFHNNNCIPCVKATSPSYWALIRREFPREFERMASLSRELDVRLCRIDGERRFIDEIPTNFPIGEAITPACDFLCHIAEQDLETL